jgi:hypothetical protein
MNNVDLVLKMFGGEIVRPVKKSGLTIWVPVKQTKKMLKKYIESLTKPLFEGI